jgi:hypothetical protein
MLAKPDQSTDYCMWAEGPIGGTICTACVPGDDPEWEHPTDRAPLEPTKQGRTAGQLIRDSIKRYTLFLGRNHIPELRPASEGAVVLYADHLADKAAELERLAEELERPVSPPDDALELRSDTLLTAAGRLRERAAEIRG